MIFLKIISIIGGFGLCAYGGYSFSRKFTERERYFAELLRFCDSVITDIGFSHVSLYLILEKNKDGYKSLLSAQLESIMGLLNSNGALSAETLSGVLPQGHLADNEFDTVTGFFDTLGKSDADSQIASVQGFKDVFSGFHKDADEKKKKYSSLYWKLGL